MKPSSLFLPLCKAKNRKPASGWHSVLYLCIEFMKKLNAMKHILSFLSFLILAVLPATAQAERPLRLMSYNIHNGIGMDGTTDYARIAAVIDSLKPDIVAVQEVDSVTRRSKGRDVLAEIAGHASMNHVFAPAISYEGGKYGIGVLSKDVPLNYYSVSLPGREEERVLLVVEFDGFVFACTHLSLTEADRDASLPVILAEAEKYGKPFFIAGDFNAEPQSRFMRRFMEKFTVLSAIDGKTCPADRPEEMIDYIAVAGSPGTAVKPAGSRIVPETVASDHRPVTADIILRR